MKYLLITWLSIFLMSCHVTKEKYSSATEPMTPKKIIHEAFKPITTNNGTGYSWHKHFASSKRENHGDYIYNQSDNMIELLNNNPNYATVIEAAQNITNGANKWLLYQNWAGPISAKVGFVISKDKDGVWTTGIISETGSIKVFESSVVIDADYNSILQLAPLECTPNVIHGNTSSISLGSKGYQKNYNFNDETFFQDGKCTSEKNARDLLNKIAKSFVSGEFE